MKTYLAFAGKSFQKMLTYRFELWIEVFINILLNALQAVEENGRIIIKSRVNEKQNNITVAVEDDGLGIAPHDIQKIFDPFFSTKSNGTGLGLAVSYGIIKNHKGDIKAYSEQGKGTRFVIEIPIAREPSPPKGGP